MTMRELTALAVTVAGAKRPCPGTVVTSGVTTTLEHGDSCCDGTGEVYALGEGARKVCNCSCHDRPSEYKYHYERCDVACPGWLPNILLPPEPCPGCIGCKGSEGIKALVSPAFNWCGGSAVVQRVDEGLLRALLEEAGYRIVYETPTARIVDAWIVAHRTVTKAWGVGSSILEAATPALGVMMKEVSHGPAT